MTKSKSTLRTTTSKPTSLQMTGGAAIDLDGGAEELFLCGGQGQNDVIFRYENGTFKDITTEVGYAKGRRRSVDERHIT